MNRKDLDRTREIILRWGWNATCYQLLNPGFERWFSSRGDAVVGFVEKYGVAVVGGAPVCAKDRLEEVIAEFESGRDRVCYFCAEKRFEDTLAADSSRAHIVIGSQPMWDPREWPGMIRSHASLRAQLYRARNKGVVAEEWPSDTAGNHPELSRCLQEWLTTRGLQPLHFLVEPDTLSRLYDRRVFVAVRGGVAIGFLVASPIPARDGWLVEQLVRGHEAVNGTTELLLDAVMGAVVDSSFVTLGLAPLSPFTERTNVHNPPWLRAMLAWMRAHGSRFYNFEGLEAYKAKFRPFKWDPLFAVVNEPRIRLSTLYAITSAFAGGSPAALVLRGVAHALATEASRAGSRIRRQR